jgi:hypothetical protein
VTYPVRVFSELGIGRLLVSNAAGAVNADYQVGDLMVITDHINLMPNPLIGPNKEEFGPRFPDMTETYSHRLRQKADTIAAEMVISLREIYPWIRLTVVLPCADQARKWNDAERVRWENIVTNSDHVETLARTFDRGCMFRRNRYLVDHADLVLACYDGDQHSGTGMTVNYAHKKNVKVRRLRLEKKPSRSAE